MSLSEEFSELMAEALMQFPENSLSQWRARFSEFSSKLYELEEDLKEKEYYKGLINLLFKLLDLSSLQEFYNESLDLLLEFTGGERGVMALFSPYRVVSVRGLRGEDLALSRSVIQLVREHRSGIVIENACQDPRLKTAASVVNLSLRSVLAVPLWGGKQVIGTIYLENRSVSGVFSKRHLDFALLSAEILSRFLEKIGEFETPLEEFRKIKEDFKFSGIAGKSKALMEVLQKVVVVSNSDLPVLIMGETGTGKELIARAIHENSPRRRKRFVTINCASVPSSLMESEFFGYKKGAFTGASSSRAGKFLMANGGTVFLDEIGDLPLELQAKLLRTLQFGEIYPLGSDEKVTVDVRIIAATNRNLEKMVEEGSFREDLFYRLNIFPINVPPLRKRKEDILEIAKFILGEGWEITPAALSLLLSYDYPGNVRELENFLKYVKVVSKDKIIDIEDLPEKLKEGKRAFEGFQQMRQALKNLPFEERENLERLFLRQSLERNHWNISKTAREIGVSRRHLYRLMDHHNLRKDKVQ